MSQLRTRWFVLFAAALLAGVAVGWFWRPFGTPQTASTPTPTHNIFTAQPGSCIADYTDAWQAEFTPVACTQPHTAEVIGTVAVSEVVSLPAAATAQTASPAQAAQTTPVVPWPGDSELSRWATIACENLPGYDASTISQLRVRWPLQADWDAGQRNYVCFSVLPAAATPTP